MRRLLKWLGPVIAVLMLGLALRSLSQALGDRSWSEVLTAMRAIPRDALVLGAILTAASYLMLTAFDTLALHHVRKPLLWRHLARVSFVAYALSLNVGIPALSAGAVRLRLYAARGLEAADIGRVLAFCFATTWVGYGTVAGIVFVATDVPLPDDFAVGKIGLRLIGVALLAASAAYLLLAWRRKKPLRIRRFEMAMPSFGIASLQLLASATQCLLAAGVAWMFLRDVVNATYPEILGAYVLAAIAGLLSHVPGGLGVAEAVFVLTLGPRSEPAALLGALLAWRLTYYVAPLLLALAVLGLDEGLRLRKPR